MARRSLAACERFALTCSEIMIDSCGRLRITSSSGHGVLSKPTMTGDLSSRLLSRGLLSRGLLSGGLLFRELCHADPLYREFSRQSTAIS